MSERWEAGREKALSHVLCEDGRVVRLEHVFNFVFCHALTSYTQQRQRGEGGQLYRAQTFKTWILIIIVLHM